MGNNEAPTPPKSDKTSSIVQLQDQPAVHPYPDWAAMHAYYGPGVMPSPYFSPQVAHGHAPHPYMWGPQHLMAPPFGSPYTAIYPHGGVYPHPVMPHGTHAHYQAIAPSPMTSEAVVMATPLSMEMPAKSGNTDKTPSKRLKGLDSLSVGNSNTANTPGAEGSGPLQSGYNSAEGSSDGSDGNNGSRGTKSKRKRSSDGTPSSGNGKLEMQANRATAGETSSKMSIGVSTAPTSITGKLVGAAPSPMVDTRVANTGKMKAIGTPIPPVTGAIAPSLSGVPSELWTQDEKELKRERRKQSNRESARRSRLRKQAETEELAIKVEALNAENTNLRSEISRLTENSDKLRLENSALVEKLKDAQSSQIEEISLGKMESNRAPVAIENFLSIIDNPGSISRTGQQEHEASDKSTTKLHQLLDRNPRTDAVAAS